MDAVAHPISFAAWQAAEQQPGDRREQAALLVALLVDRHAAACKALPALKRRLVRHAPDFWEAYAALYGSSFDQIAGVVRLFDGLIAGVQARSDDLRALDARREKNPRWFQHQKMIGMMLYVDLFAGDLPGVQRKIPYFKELGVTYVHLMPLLKPRAGLNDGGYAVQDYRAVDPRLGTMDDLRALARTMREAGIALVIDFVMNHTAREHAWAQAALAGDERFQAFFFTFDDRALPDAYEASLPEVFPDFAPGNFTYQPEIEKWVWTTFYDFQWDLNYTNPEVFEHIFEEMLFLANLGVDGLRLDAVPFLWKQMGTNCQNLEGAHRLLRAYRALMRIAAPGLLFKAEAIVAPDDIIRYLGVGGYEGKACDVAYNAALMCHLWHALAAEDTALLQTTLRNLPAAPESALWLNYVRCHDDIGWGLDDEDAAEIGQDGHAARMFCTAFYTGETPPHYAEGYRFQVDAHTGEARISGTAAALTGLQRAQVSGASDAVEESLQRLLMLHSVIFTMKGVPLLYSGDEVGQLNDFSYLQDPLKALDNRWMHRSRMDWDKAALRSVPGTVEHRLFDGLQRFARVRKRLKALHVRADERLLYTENDRLFVVERTYGAARLLVVSNFSSRPQALPLGVLPAVWRGEAFTDALHGQAVHFSSGRVVLPPYGFWWLIPAPDAAPGRLLKTPIRLPVETVWGERVYLTGSAEALGRGDPQRAVGPLDVKDYPYWTTEVEVPAGVYFEFRWIKMRGRRIAAWAPHSYWMRAGNPRIFALEKH